MDLVILNNVLGNRFANLEDTITGKYPWTFGGVKQEESINSTRVYQQLFVQLPRKVPVTMHIGSKFLSTRTIVG